MDKLDTHINKRINILAFIVIIIATFAMMMQFKILYEIGVATTSQVFVVSATAVMQMAALLVIALQKTQGRLDKVSTLAYADELTGLINRRKFNEILDEKLIECRETKKKLGVLILDLDRFKLINDCHGHDAGDKVLCQFGDLIQKSVGSDSVTCRMSGDEFAVIINNVTNENSILDICKDILAEMKQPFKYEGKKIHTSASIGAAIVDGFETEDLSALRMADFALLNSKNSGRNQVLLFNEKMAEQLKRRRNIEASMSNAISGNALSLKYLPFVLQDSSKISGVEALIRWHDPIEGEILPSEFMPVAQELGLLEEIGEFILERACEEIKPFADIHLAINIDSAQFAQEGFVEQIKRVLTKTGFGPNRLELELEQNLLVSKSEKIRADLELIRSLGVRIVLDDFGTSYSSMIFLRDFKLDRVKLDRNFVSNMRLEKDGNETIQNMIGLGSTFSNRLTVEGIETKEQLETVQKSGVNDLQGFLFSKPLTLPELENSKMIADLKKRKIVKSNATMIDSSAINRLAG